MTIATEKAALANQDTSASLVKANTQLAESLQTDNE